MPWAQHLNRVHVRIVVVSSLVLSITCGLKVARGGGAEAVIRAWGDRQARVESFDVSWTGTLFQKVDNGETGTPGQGGGEGIKPPSNHSFATGMRFAADGKGRVRFDYQGQTWSSQQGAFIPEMLTDVFDGRVRKSFFPEGKVGFPNAHISTGSARETGRRVQTLPIRLIYRPFDSALGEFDSTKLVLTEAQGVAEGRPCLILESEGHAVWVDGGKAYVPVRWFEYRRGAVFQSLEMNYQKDDQGGWSPSGWKYTRLCPSGEISESLTATVTSARINSHIPDETFEIQYPDGTWVKNYDTHERYILRGKGDRRPVLDGEFDGTNYQQLLHSDPPGGGRGRWFWTLLAANITLLIAIVAVGFYYRRRVRRV